ncbi:hypothetical protein [Streptomyces humidus]|uniref:hypothetical protein n=1 Tax=Streptomyces humidus TaxID=52259 RepID=UPI003323955E
MSQENTPTAATVPAVSPAPTRTRTAARAVGFGCAVLLAVPLLLLLAFVVWIAVVTKDASDFPRAAPEAMASRAAERSQEAYGVLGFTRTLGPGAGQPGVSAENTFGSDACYRGGLTDEEVDGAYSMHHSWALDHVPAGQARAGLRRLRDHLEDSGWDITSYREDVSGDRALKASRSEGEERMWFKWSADRGYFTGGASMACAVDPGRGDGDDRPGDDLTPPDLHPSTP